MSELHDRITDTMSRGLHCSQTMLLLANEVRGAHNPDAIRAVGGLGGGMFCGKNCGTLTGGAAILGLYGARGEPGDEPSYDYRAAVKELVAWFEGEFGSVECRDLVSEEREERLRICPGFVEKTFLKCMEILEAAGIDPNE